MKHYNDTAIIAIAVQYRETAEWADGCEGDYTCASWSLAAIEEAKEVAAKFVSDAAEILERLDLDWSDIGHNLWLSRNGHGTGFWDRGWGDVGDKLHEIAKAMGPRSIYAENDEIFFDIG